MSWRLSAPRRPGTAAPVAIDSPGLDSADGGRVVCVHGRVHRTRNGRARRGLMRLRLWDRPGSVLPNAHGREAMSRPENLAARAGRWSAAHWKSAVFGWLAFVA